MMYTQEFKNAAAAPAKKQQILILRDALILQVVKDLKSNWGMTKQKLIMLFTVAD